MRTNNTPANRIHAAANAASNGRSAAFAIVIIMFYEMV